MSFETIMNLPPGELAERLIEAEKRMIDAQIEKERREAEMAVLQKNAAKGTQVVFKQPSAAGTGRMPKEYGVEVMHALGSQLFKRPPIVQLHWETKRFCRCDDCDKYFEMWKYDPDLKKEVLP